MSNTTQMPTKSTLRQDCLSAVKCFQSATLVILCHDSKEAFHSECSLLASLIRFLVIILTNTSLQLVNFLSRRLFTTCKVIYATYRDGRTSSPLALIILSLLTECGRKGKTMRRSATFAVILGLAVLALTVQLLPELSARSDQNEGNVFTVISRDAVACGRT